MDDSGRSMYAILGAAQHIQERLESGLEAVGVSGAKYAALDALVKAQEPLPLSEMAARLDCVRSNVTQLMDRLEADGLVRRVSDSVDRRSIRAELTELGRERHAAAAEVMARLHAELDALVGPEERALLQRIRTALG